MVRFVNEMGNTVSLHVVLQDQNVRVVGQGPTSHIDHLWTLREAVTLRDLLTTALSGAV